VNTLTLFDTAPHPRARAVDTQTALDAAKSITPGRTETLILDLFARERCGMTDDEIAARLAQCYSPTVRSARSRLTKAGLLVDSGERRPSGRGRTMIAWRVA
jgi:predicted ArsR family transcriptional regulator